MRVLFFPFDVVNYSCGMTGIAFGDFMVATVIGTLPSLITLSVLGDAFNDPKTFLLFVILLVITLLVAFYLQRHPWVRNKLRTHPAHSQPHD